MVLLLGEEDKAAGRAEIQPRPIIGGDRIHHCPRWSLDTPPFKLHALHTHPAILVIPVDPS